MNQLGELFPTEMVLPWITGRDTSPAAREEAAHWLYAHNAAMAYREFKKRGRGCIAGPFPTDKNGNFMGGEQLGRILDAEPYALNIAYLTPGETRFSALIDSAEARDILTAAIDAYSPEAEVVIAMFRNGHVQEVAVPTAHGIPTPEELYRASRADAPVKTN